MDEPSANWPSAHTGGGGALGLGQQAACPTMRYETREHNGLLSRGLIRFIFYRVLFLASPGRQCSRLASLQRLQKKCGV